jgi:hypothetical protein
VFDLDWAGVARGAIAVFVVGGLCVYWNDRRWRNRAR